MTILMVEDDRDQRFFRVGLVNEFFPGHEILEAIDGSSALEIMSHKSVDVIVTDIGMFPMDGIDLIKAVRQNNKDTPIFVVSGDMLGCREAKNEGATKVFMKPLDEDVFVKALKSVLG